MKKIALMTALIFLAQVTISLAATGQWTTNHPERKGPKYGDSFKNKKGNKQTRLETSRKALK